jgi:type II secretory pathway pseudopilin PulG
MRLRLPSRFRCGPRSERDAAFTMVEIALCIAIIGFALVAIIGVLPTGMKVQKDNREDTIIGQDGTFLLEAIRSGSRGLDELTNYVTNVHGFGVPLDGRTIVGLLTRPSQVNTADVLAISGALAEKGASTAARDFAFSYRLRTEVVPFAAFKGGDQLAGAISNAIASNLYEVRLDFRWPLYPSGQEGNGVKHFRLLVSGQLTNDGPPNNLHFFVPARHPTLP